MDSLEYREEGPAAAPAESAGSDELSSSCLSVEWPNEVQARFRCMQELICHLLLTNQQLRMQLSVANVYECDASQELPAQSNNLLSTSSPRRGERAHAQSFLNSPPGGITSL